jgi:hypothetical protein
VDIQVRRRDALLQRRSRSQDCRLLPSPPFESCPSRPLTPKIIFDTKNDIAKNLGILLGWIGFSFVTISLATWLTRRNSVNEHRREMAAKRLDQEKL